MPYNTRRKSLSLPSLGIQLPHSSRSLHQQTPPASAHPHPHLHHHHQPPPHKKVKRDHSPTIRLAHSTTTNKPGRYDPTPPPSPPPPEGQSGRIKIDYAELNDEIVAGVVGILEETGNRPHTVKELALSLAPTVNLVENSANPHAIISSRLNTYLKRGSTPVAAKPCILKKELVTTHPRRIYFYLTTQPSQPIPQHDNDMMPPARRSIVSPALSADEGEDEDEDEDQHHHRHHHHHQANGHHHHHPNHDDNDDTDETEELRRMRAEMSPSPEVDLSSHALTADGDGGDPADDAAASGLMSATATMIAHQRSGTRSPASPSYKNPLASPPLEGDEREFSQSAIYIERRRSASSSLSLSLARERDPRGGGGGGGGSSSGRPTASSGGKRSRDEYEYEANADASPGPGPGPGDGVAGGDDQRTYDEAAAALLGYSADASGVDAFSPTLAPATLDPGQAKSSDGSRPDKMVVGADAAGLYCWGGELERHLASPESVALDELDDLLDF